MKETKVRNVDHQMRLSHEIIVLDYGDERSSPYEPEKKQEKKVLNGNCELILSCIYTCKDGSENARNCQF